MHTYNIKIYILPYINVTKQYHNSKSHSINEQEILYNVRHFKQQLQYSA